MDISFPKLEEKQVTPTSPTFTGVRQGADPQHTITIFNYISSQILTPLSVPWILSYVQNVKRIESGKLALDHFLYKLDLCENSFGISQALYHDT